MELRRKGARTLWSRVHSDGSYLLNLTVGQTYAVALAESGSFTEVAKLQQETIIGSLRRRSRESD